MQKKTDSADMSREELFSQGMSFYEAGTDVDALNSSDAGKEPHELELDAQIILIADMKAQQRRLETLLIVNGGNRKKALMDFKESYGYAFGTQKKSHFGTTP